MKIIRWVPPALGGGATRTLPAWAPDIDDVVAAEITRIPNAFVLAHADSGVVVAHADGALPVGHAGMAVKDHVFTQPNPHTLTPDAVLATTNALGIDAAGNMETAAKGAVALGTCIDVHAGGAVDAHTVTAQPDNHLQAAIVAALANHGAIAAALIDHAASGATVAVAAGAVVRLTKRTFTIANLTLLGDMLQLSYHEVGERVLVS